MFALPLCAAAIVVFNLILASCEATMNGHGHLAFVDSFCTDEGFHANASLPAAALAIERVNSDILSNGNQLYFYRDVSVSDTINK